MADKWKFVSEDGETISLHDHCITSVEEDGPDLILRFDEDGFDVTKDTPLIPPAGTGTPARLRSC